MAAAVELPPYCVRPSLSFDVPRLKIIGCALPIPVPIPVNLNSSDVPPLLLNVPLLLNLMLLILPALIVPFLISMEAFVSHSLSPCFVNLKVIVCLVP